MIELIQYMLGGVRLSPPLGSGNCLLPGSDCLEDVPWINFFLFVRVFDKYIYVATIPKSRTTSFKHVAFRMVHWRMYLECIHVCVQAFRHHY